MFLVKHCVNWAVMKWASLLGPSLSLQHLFHNIVVIRQRTTKHPSPAYQFHSGTTQTYITKKYDLIRALFELNLEYVECRPWNV